jgi:hypothetical protein
MTNIPARNHHVKTAFQSFADFWPFYVREHSQLGTRILHYIGTAGIFPIIAAAVVLQRPLVLLLVPVFAYGFAWIGHFFVEHNKPAAIRYPLWSLLADFKMFGLMLVGRMGEEVARCNSLAKH